MGHRSLCRGTLGNGFVCPGTIPCSPCPYQRCIVLQMLRKRQSYLRRSDSQQAVKSPPLLDSPDSSREPIVKLSSKLSSVSLRGISTSSSTGDMSADDFHGNYAFEGIGDDDL
uniref:Uncharacterized protein n=1 Tax=Xenopus tropicalis TaxID=8364 RepID=A0A1B8XT07_XENTR